jgi:hypothetical protein
VDVGLEVEVDVPELALDVVEADEGRFERLGSATKVAVVPVSFLQTDCVAVAAPATKFTAAHYVLLVNYPVDH